MKSSARYTQMTHQYRELLPVEQDLLQVCAIIDTTMDKARIFKCIQKIKTPALKTVRAAAHCGIFLDNLREKGWLDTRNQCKKPYREFATIQAIRKKNLQRILKAITLSKSVYDTTYTHSFREFRVALFTGNTEIGMDFYRLIISDVESQDQSHPFLDVFTTPFIPEFIEFLNFGTQSRVLLECLNYSRLILADDKDLLDYATFFIQSNFRSKADTFMALKACVALRYMLYGHLDTAETLQQEITRSGVINGQNGLVEALKGDVKKAHELIEDDVSKASVYGIATESSSFTSYIQALVYFKMNDSEAIEKLIKIYDDFLERFDREFHPQSPHFYLSMILKKHQDPEYKGALLHPSDLPYLAEETQLFAIICNVILAGDFHPDVLSHMRLTLIPKALKNGHFWVALSLAELILSTGRGDDELIDISQSIQNTTDLAPVSSLLVIRAAWENKLNMLNSYCDDLEKNSVDNGDERLALILSYRSVFDFDIVVKEQRKTAKGTWTKGSRIHPESFDYYKNASIVTEHDKRIFEAAEPDPYRRNRIVFNHERLLSALIGHPRVFSDASPPDHLEIVQGNPEIHVSENQDVIHIRFANIVDANRGYQLVKESPKRFKVIRYSQSQRTMAGILGEKGLTVPVSAKEKVLATVHAVSKTVTVQSDIGGGDNLLVTIDGDPITHAHLSPMGKGFQVSFFVMPMGEAGPLLIPGEGGSTIISEINGERMRAKRDLGLERTFVHEIMDACGALSGDHETQHTWMIDTLESCLETLIQLKGLSEKGRVIVKWPEGETFKVICESGKRSLKLSIGSHMDWFEVDGTLEADDGTVVQLKKLLELMEQTPSRFIPLDNGQYLALTDSLKRRLANLARWTEKKRNKRVFHPCASPAVHDLVEGLGTVKCDKKWNSQKRRLEKEFAKTPSVPTTLKADLRDYQKEGFAWMHRLSSLSMGACLCDDMGLGKTLQALSVILSRAPEGPSLVVAPTSVCLNWSDEIRRFTPALNPVIYGGKDRDGIMKSLTPMDILIVSYGLIHYDIDRFTPMNWNTIVLDEAQAIKNAKAKRSKAVMTLSGRFKIITTGTPVENHLGELKSLFDFINPGLLGSNRSFSQRFANPIEKQKDRDAQNSLKKLIQPFILRRIKSDVLDELPPKTEITLRVEMSPEEASFYEAVRQKAIENLFGTEDMRGGEQQLRILAEITRLRQACCNPELIVSGSGIDSSKLSEFGSLVEELLESRHKALVFSQFTGHLSLVRKYLDKKGVSYHYLDGSTPAKTRKKSVDAFQAGEGDLFLISLKAGGTGLNLTAATYVIHLDPWWNPAVEDQATDRAYRMGQNQPVTVYRLVMKNTIEEKIIRLHHEKRHLAESLLDGTDMSGKMTPDELLALIKD